LKARIEFPNLIYLLLLGVQGRTLTRKILAKKWSRIIRSGVESPLTERSEYKLPVTYIVKASRNIFLHMTPFLRHTYSNESQICRHFHSTLLTTLYAKLIRKILKRVYCVVVGSFMLKHVLEDRHSRIIHKYPENKINSVKNCSKSKN